MAEIAEQTVTVPQPAEDRRGFWSIASFWGLHAWVFAYCFVMLSAFYIQLALGEFPCPLCMLQRYGMILSTSGALLVIMQARRGTLTHATYSQGLGMGLLGALVGGAEVSMRQILLHIKPGDPGYGAPVLGLHLYTWALITFIIVIAYCGFRMVLSPRGIPQAPAPGSAAWKLSTAIIWLFIGVVAANVIAIIFLEGFAWVLPDDPTGYTLLDQIRAR